MITGTPWARYSIDLGRLRDPVVRLVVQQREPGQGAVDDRHRLLVRQEAEPVDPRGGRRRGPRSPRASACPTSWTRSRAVGARVQQAAEVDQLVDPAAPGQVPDVDDAGVVGRQRTGRHLGRVRHDRVRLAEPVPVARARRAAGSPAARPAARSGVPPQAVGRPSADGSHGFSVHGGGGVLVHVPHHRRQVEPAQGEQQLRVVQEYDVVPGAAGLEQRAGRTERGDPATARAPAAGRGRSAADAWRRPAAP